MEPKIFYRVEKDGIGPYGFNVSWMDTLKKHTDENHPGPYQEKVKNTNRVLAYEIGEVFIKQNEIELYAFESINMFLDWFSIDEIEELFDMGFKVIKIISTKYILGEKQAIFGKNKSKLLDSIFTIEEFNERILDF